jgi:UDP-glucose:(heptosyl)LPS alpha-1,3-glucosyltransferase
VADWLDAHPHPGWLIHSHERLNVHHITTFHGPPFATIFEKPFWRRVSLRVWMQLYLERRELATALVIVPNSSFIQRQLIHYYPLQQGKLAQPIVPGITPGPIRPWRAVPDSGGIVGFVGKEWKRKGLPRAIEIIARLRQVRPNLELWVAGPDPQEVQHLFNAWQGGFRLLGWRNDADYFREIDVLLHPAESEPYGMVISEAMAARVPVVVSDVCGAAADVAADSGQVLSLQEPLDSWATAVAGQLSRSTPPFAFEHSWLQVAEEYAGIYEAINTDRFPAGNTSSLPFDDQLHGHGRLKPRSIRKEI